MDADRGAPEPGGVAVTAPGRAREDAASAEERPPAAVRDHLANERTLLAWIRTALTVVGLGFVVDRLALDTGGGVLAAIVGIGLVVFGALVALGGAYRFVRTEQQIDTATYRPSVRIHLALTAAVVLGAAAVTGYLLVAPRG